MTERTLNVPTVIARMRTYHESKEDEFQTMLDTNPDASIAAHLHAELLKHQQFSEVLRNIIGQLETNPRGT